MPRPAKPKPAKPLTGGTVLFFSPAYRVGFLGLERLHPADTFRADRIAEYLVSEQLLSDACFGIPLSATLEQLSMVHDPGYLASLQKAQTLRLALEVPIPTFLGSGILNRRVLLPFQHSSGGTIAAAQAAVKDGCLAINLGGGFHHARPALGHGFCLYNDVAIAISQLRYDGFSGNVLVVDTDVHQGDGTHACLAGWPGVFSFSMHQDELFPHPKVPGDLDVPVPRGSRDADFLALLKSSLQDIFSAFQPELVFHVAGADVLHDDPLGELNLTVEGLVSRDVLVANAARSRNIPHVHLLAGGYGPSAATAQGRSIAAMLRREAER